MNNDNQTSVIANAYLKMLQDRFAPEQSSTEQPTESVEPADDSNTEETPE